MDDKEDSFKAIGDKCKSNLADIERRLGECREKEEFLLLQKQHQANASVLFEEKERKLEETAKKFARGRQSYE